MGGGLFFLFSVSGPCFFFSFLFFFLGGGSFLLLFLGSRGLGGGVVVLPGWLHLHFRVTIR